MYLPIWSKIGSKFVNTHIVCCENQAVEHRRSADSICPTDFIHFFSNNFLSKSQYAISKERTIWANLVLID